MPDVFVSYTKQDRDFAARLANALESNGWTIWWDREIPPGRTFDEVIEEALSTARCVLVLWSEASVASRWVRAEASEANERGVLIPVFVHKVEPPLEFRNIQAADLSDWGDDPNHPELRRLFATVASLLKAPPRPSVPAVPAPPRAARRLPPALQGTAIGVVGIIAGAALMFLLQKPAPVSPARSTEPRAATPSARSEPSAPVTSSSTPPVPSSVTASKDVTASGRMDLLAAANGGHLVRAPHQNWMEVIDGKEDWAYLTGNEAVYGFKDDRPATFDTFKMLITETRDWNIKTFELLASDAANGEFRLLGTFETQNVRLFPSPWQEFTFTPTTAKYLKVRVRELFKGSANTQAEQWQLIGKF